MKLTDYFIQIVLLLHLTVVGFIKPEVAERAKRMLFLTSLATALAKEGIIKRNILDSLNDDLKLAKNDHCLLLGKELSKTIWSHRRKSNTLFRDSWTRTPAVTDEGIFLEPATDSFLGLDDIKKLSTKLIQAAPGWVKYDSGKMQADVTDLFITNPILKSIELRV